MDESNAPTVSMFNASVLWTALVGNLLNVALLALGFPLLLLLTMGSAGPNSFERLAPFWIAGGALLLTLAVLLPFALGWLGTHFTLSRQRALNITPHARFSVEVGMATAVLGEIPIILLTVAGGVGLIPLLTSIGASALAGYFAFVWHRSHAQETKPPAPLSGPAAAA